MNNYLILLHQLQVRSHPVNSWHEYCSLNWNRLSSVVTLFARVWGERHWGSRGHVSRVTCTGVGTHSGVLTPSSVAPALGQGWVRTEPGHPPSPARAACSLEQLLVSPGWAGLGWAGLVSSARSPPQQWWFTVMPHLWHFSYSRHPQHLNIPQQLHLLNSHLSDRGDLAYILHFTLQKHLKLLPLGVRIQTIFTYTEIPPWPKWYPVGFFKTIIGKIASQPLN